DQPIDVVLRQTGVEDRVLAGLDRQALHGLARVARDRRIDDAGDRRAVAHVAAVRRRIHVHDLSVAPTAGRNRGSVISGVTSSNTTSTGMPARTSADAQPTILASTRTPGCSSISTSTGTYGPS